jgi:5-methyltetrahydrofolate--homocysteine methyltransferase
MANKLEHITQVVVEGKHNEIENLVKEAIQEGLNTDQILNEALIFAMDIVGQKFRNAEIFVPEMLASAWTMKKGLEIVKPLLKGSETKSKGTILMGTAKGDIHDIGKNLVIMMLEGAGFHVIDLGVDLDAEKIVEKVKELKPDVLGLSALLTTTMPEMKKVIEALEKKKLRNSVKVMIGGAPVDATFAEKIGADGYGKDAAQAVDLAKRFTTQ